jgi:hypothetical protein
MRFDASTIFREEVLFIPADVVGRRLGGCEDPVDEARIAVQGSQVDIDSD